MCLVLVLVLIKDHLIIKRMLTTWHPYTRASFFSQRLSASPRKKSPTETRTTKDNLSASVYTHYQTEMYTEKRQKEIYNIPLWSHHLHLTKRESEKLIREKNTTWRWEKKIKYELSDDGAKKVSDDKALITYICTFLKHGAILCLLWRDFKLLFAVNVSLQMRFDWSIKNSGNLLVATAKSFWIFQFFQFFFLLHKLG